ncbi:MAG: hypothetical protein WAO35_24785 [Terriglobia bacterium]
MELIDRYVHEVGEHLPYRMRADVEAELRSLLMDALEERAAAARPPDAELAAAVLREFGPPQEVAQRYAPQAQYLIGPRLFPAYKRTLMVLATVFAALLLASGVLSALRTIQHAGQGIAPMPLFGGLLGILLSAGFNFALVTLAFAITERVTLHRELTGKNWEPQSLPALHDPDRISPAGRVIEVYLLLIGAVWFNFYPQWVGFAVIYQGVTVIRLLRPEFSMYLPWLNVFWALDFAYKVWVLRLGRRTRETRWASFGLSLLGVVILYLMISGPPVFRFDTLIKQALTLFLLFQVFISGMELYRILAHKPFAPWRGLRSVRF